MCGAGRSGLELTDGGIAAGLFGGVELGVGGGEHRIRIGHAGLERRNADRDGDGDRPAARLEAVELDTTPCALRDDAGACELGLRHHDGELVATEARQALLPPDALARDLDDRAQYAVARGVAEAIVDLLEAVDVEEQERQWPGVAAAARDFAREEVHQIPAVERAREAVHDRELVQLLVVLRLEIVAGEKLECDPHELHTVAGLQHGLLARLERAPVQPGAVGRAEIAQENALALAELAVLAGDAVDRHDHFAAGIAPDRERGRRERNPATDVGATDHDQAGRGGRTVRAQQIDRTDPRGVVHWRTPVSLFGRPGTALKRQRQGQSARAALSPGPLSRAATPRPGPPQAVRRPRA